MNHNPPIIIIGMSRSGTSMLTRILDDLGFFAGSKLTSNHEAEFFRELNDWLLAQCSGGLENPSTIKYLLRDKEARPLFAEFIRYTLSTPRAASFMGWKNYFSYRSPANFDFPWGWKDPRNTYTLPFWLDIFPDAKIIHIYRHPLDIVNSLITRRKRGLSRLEEGHSKIKNLYWYYLMQRYIPKKKVFVDLRGGTLEEGLQMWEEYMHEARSHVKELGDRAAEVKYEDFLESPSGILTDLSEFCGINAAQSDISKVAEQINKSRAYAYLKDPKLKEFSKQVEDRLMAYGY